MNGMLKYSNPYQLTEGRYSGQWARQITLDWIQGHKEVGYVYFNPTATEIVRDGEIIHNKGIEFRWNFDCPLSDYERERERQLWGEHDFITGDLIAEAKEVLEKRRELNQKYPLGNKEA